MAEAPVFSRAVLFCTGFVKPAIALIARINKIEVIRGTGRLEFKKGNVTNIITAPTRNRVLTISP